MTRNVEAARAWNSFWRDLVVLDGQVDRDLVANELFDYLTLIKAVAQVYPGITCGRVTDHMTFAEDVIRVSEECANALVDDALAQAMAELLGLLDGPGDETHRLGEAREYASQFARVKKQRQPVYKIPKA